ncbi:hypothetical protein RDV84_15410 [Lysobacter yananisis]|uniref:Tetratricopeptide repeat protein n=1 Tax=Lysobacter yananisis TaxID=1003114 RepID=A0ABY9P5G9_9GAMM|nr:hypothetical protein [Lysobacter yananisis]WMT01376.1 hypothetical protein RDV84_15410 [Lysobacter yananisis]
MSNIESTKDLAEEALARGEYETAVTAATALVEAGEPWLLDGLVRRAMALENWADGPPDRLVAAANDWQRMIEIAPAPVSYRGLARVLLKLGDRDFALVNLLEAERRGATPEVLLGFAEYYRTASPPDLGRAKAYFLRAALRGRTQGIRGYGEVAYELDQPFSGAAMALIGLVATPLLALILGERRHAGF